MTSTDQKRAMLLTRLLVGEITVTEAATLMGLSERQVWRLKSAFQRAGPEGLVHGNRGRPSPRRLSDATRAQHPRARRQPLWRAERQPPDRFLPRSEMSRILGTI